MSIQISRITVPEDFRKLVEANSCKDYNWHFLPFLIYFNADGTASFKFISTDKVKEILDRIDKCKLKSE